MPRLARPQGSGFASFPSPHAYSTFIPGSDNAVLGDIRDPELRTRYEAQEMERKQAKES
jgi:hypothetical protein